MVICAYVNVKVGQWFIKLNRGFEAICGLFQNGCGNAAIWFRLNVHSGPGLNRSSIKSTIMDHSYCLSRSAFAMAALKTGYLSKTATSVGYVVG